MKIKLAIMFVIYTSNFFGQIIGDEINGRWIKFKVEMKDGSKLLPRPNADSTYYEFNITNSKISINSFPIYRSY